MPETPVRAYVNDHARVLYDDLDAWLRIPSISADPAHADDVRRSAQWLADAFRREGFPVVEIWETTEADGTPGRPAVFAEWVSDDPGAPHVVVYGHHDVQPVDPIGQWDHAPFAPTIVGDTLFARGASDDKGMVAFHLLGLRAHLATTGRTSPAVTLRFLVEGEEESGSPNFARLLTEHRDRLPADAVVVSDTGIFAEGVPSVVVSMRGMTQAEVTILGPTTDLHSGQFGGAVPNPLHVLADVVAALHDADGRVTLPGFYDRVLPVSDAERALTGRLPFDEQHWLDALALSRAATGEAGFTTLERTGARPTAEVNGMWGGYTGPGQKTIIPAEAHAKVSFRLVADQRPDEVHEQFRSWLAENVPGTVRWDVHFFGPGVAPCATPLDAPALQAVLRAVGDAFDAEVLTTREGGSGPEAALQEILAAPVVFLGTMLPGDRFHAPNERVSLPMLLKGAEAAAYLWADMATSLRRP